MDWTIFWTLFFGGGKADHRHLGVGGMQSINIQGGMVGRLLLLREGWRTNYSTQGGVGGLCMSNYYFLLWSVHLIIQIVLSGFSTDYSYVKIFVLGRSVYFILVMRMRNWHLNTGL